ncbi:hypothetical protein BKA70DRAFT_1418996 [Coprinopsis sp. MPI-PUGE-AT-0042]|nr:hypothetical protein BKA70DRAFT_1418996 [Coprinopsis sp. MPI-PUGE-AT-0042]
MHVPRLPPEVISLIVDQVAVAGKGPWKGLKRDLKACSLTNRLFLSLTRPHLFASISLSIKRAQNSTASLKYTIFSHFPIAQHVKELRLTYADASKMPGILALRDLQSFCFRFDIEGSPLWDSLPSVLQRGIKNLILRSPGLTRFETDMIAFPSKDVIPTNLQHLVLMPQLGRPLGGSHHVLVRKWESFLEQAPLLKTLDLSGFYEPTLDGMLSGSEGNHLVQLEVLTVVIENGNQYNLVKKLLSHNQALKEVNLALRCALVSDDYLSLYPVPLASLHASSRSTLQRLRLDLYVWVADDSPATWGAQYLGLTYPCTDNPLGRPALLSFIALTSLKLTIYLYGDLGSLVASENWKELDALFALPDTLPHLRELVIDITITPEADTYLGSVVDPVEDAQALFNDVDPRVFNSKDGCFVNIWKRAKDEGQRKFKFKPCVRPPVLNGNFKRLRAKMAQNVLHPLGDFLRISSPLAPPPRVNAGVIRVPSRPHFHLLNHDSPVVISLVERREDAQA